MNVFQTFFEFGFFSGNQTNERGVNQKWFMELVLKMVILEW